MAATAPLSPSERTERLLGAAGVAYAIVGHRRAACAADEARAMGLPAEQTAKLVVLLDGEAPLAVMVAACDRVDLQKVRRALGCSLGLRLAAEAELHARFPAFEPGAVPPLAPFARLALDQRLLTYGRVVCAAGDCEHSALVDPEAIVRATGAVVADVVLGAGSEPS